jgi:hypothetical protein
VKVPRFKIAWLMVFVAIAALNFWVFRICYYDLWTNDAATANKIDVLYTGSIPMANILMLGILISLWRRGSRPFLLGFEILGAAALVVYITICILYCHEMVRPYLFRFQVPVFNTIGRSHAHIPIFRFTAAVILVWPQMAFALLGGFLSRKFRIVRRSDGTG